MIDLFDGQLLDLLPVPWKTEETDAISYALQWASQMLIDLAKQTRLRADVDDLPERILDIMAVEMQAPYYRQTLPIETKREIIKRTVKWHMHAGTPSVLQELMEVVFGQGRVIENWEFTEPPFGPYLFDLETNAQLTPDIMERLAVMLGRVKNVRSHLRRLWIRREVHQTEHVGTGIIGVPKSGIDNNRAQRHADIRVDEYVGTGLQGVPRGAVDNNRAQRHTEYSLSEYVGTGIQGVPRSAIDNIREPRHTDVELHEHLAAALTATPRSAITNERDRFRQMSETVFAALGLDGTSRTPLLGGGERPAREMRERIVVATAFCPAEKRTGILNGCERERTIEARQMAATAIVRMRRRPLVSMTQHERCFRSRAPCAIGIVQGARTTIRLGGIS